MPLASSTSPPGPGRLQVTKPYPAGGRPLQTTAPAE
jgi:hypothetical protein